MPATAGAPDGYHTVLRRCTCCCLRVSTGVTVSLAISQSPLTFARGAMVGFGELITVIRQRMYVILAAVQWLSLVAQYTSKSYDRQCNDHQV